MITILTVLILTLPTVHAHDNRWKVVQPYNQKLERIAHCESPNHKVPSGVGWFAHKRGSKYYGGLQFDLKTWHSVGGRGYPNKNSKLEQKFRAVLLIRARGYRPWPICGYV